MKIGFVILHYQNKEVTEKCLNLLLKLTDIEKNEIVVVDNASPNGSGAELKRKYKKHEQIYVLLNLKNEGFAKGNNSGYLFAKNNLNCGIIIVMNSDVYIEQLDFIEKVKWAFKKNPEYSVLAPDIWAMKGGYQNPLSVHTVSKKFADQWYIKVTMIYWLLCVPVLNRALVAIILDKRQKSEAEKRSQIKNRIPKVIKNIIPHGACIVYGNNWVKNENIAFVPYTFLYAEEYLLSYYAQCAGYTCIFYPKLKVTHEAGASTRVELKTQLPKMRFAYKNERYSISKLRKLIDDDGSISI